MTDEQRKCEAGDYGWGECENLATRKARVQHDEWADICDDCYEAAQGADEAAFRRWIGW